MSVDKPHTNAHLVDDYFPANSDLVQDLVKIADKGIDNRSTREEDQAPKTPWLDTLFRWNAS